MPNLPSRNIRLTIAVKNYAKRDEVLSNLPDM